MNMAVKMESHLEAVNKQQVELSPVLSAQNILLQVPQVALNVSLRLVETETPTR